jgi:hypothetical protein
MAGMTNGSFGVASLPNMPDLELAFERLSESGLVCNSATELTTRKYGIDFTPSDAVPAHHSVKYLAADESGQNPSAVVFGTHPQGSIKFKSMVHKSVISDDVEKYLDLPRIHGAPSGYKVWRHWHRDLDNMTHPKGNFEAIPLMRATEDLKRKWRNYCLSHKKELELIIPYPREVIINGVDGVNSVDRIDMNTSMGFPLNKAKKFFMAPSEEEYPGITVAFEFTDPEVWEWVDHYENELAAGRRINTIFRANLKDEPTKFSKDKIRVFAGCEVAFTLLVRKYYLPIVRMIQNSNFELECAVGVNATSKEWSKLALRLKKFGGQKCFDGDYKAFDKTATIEAIMRAFDVLIEVAKCAKWCDRFIRIMRGIATEISQPLYEYDGIFIMIFGSNPSGHPLTVIINNVINALYMRYAYYKHHESDDDIPDFDQRISLNCYGDDNGGEFHPDETLGMDDIGRILGECGITYTTADKKIITRKSMPFEEVSFLKRGFKWSEELGYYLAPIELASISKSLHNMMKRKGSETLPEVIAASAIHSANREFFHHGKEVFEVRREQLLELLFNRPDIAQYVGSLPDYEDLKLGFLDATPKKSSLQEPLIMQFD